MFESLSEKLSGILDKLTGRGALSEEDVNAAMREVRRALLEADVALDVVRSFVDRTRTKAIGASVVKSVKPGQDRRADLPTIGPETIRLAADAGLAGVAYDAGGTILAEREACIARADGFGLFLLGFDPETTEQGS